MSLHTTQSEVFATALEKVLSTWFAAGFAVDALIAIAMIFIVTNAKTNATFRRTNDILTKVLIRAVATGLINAIINGLGLLFLYAWPTFDLAEIPPYTGGKLYSNALLVTLNARYTDAEVHYAPNSTTNLSSSAPRNVMPGNLESLKFAPNMKLKQQAEQGKTSTGVSRGNESEMMTGSLDTIARSTDNIQMLELNPGHSVHREEGTKVSHA